MVEEIAHQVRNPIVSLGGYTKRLQKDWPSSQKGRYYLNQILRETIRLETLIQRVEEYVLIPRPIFRKDQPTGSDGGSASSLFEKDNREGNLT